MATICKSRAELTAALANGKQVVILVSGNDPGTDAIVQRAEKAVLLPETQAVVWVQDGSICPEYQGGPDVVACALSTAPRVVCAYVPRAKALAAFFMQAVTAAQNRTQPPVAL